MLEYPAVGFYIQSTANVTVRNCEVAKYANHPSCFCHALEAHNAAELILEGFRGEAAFPRRCPALLRC